MEPVENNSRPWHARWAWALLSLAALACYSNTFSVPFHFDDNAIILRNAQIRSLDPRPVWTNWPRPVGTYTFALNYAWHEYHVTGYHAVNLAIHIAAAWVLYLLVRDTLQSGRAGRELQSCAAGVALASALIWVSHPLQTQAVTYIVQRLESLMGLLFLCGVYALQRGARNESRWWLAASVLACGLGAGVKEVIAVAPLVIAWYDRAFVARSWSEMGRKRGLYYAALCVAIGGTLFAYRGNIQIDVAAEAANGGELISHANAAQAVPPLTSWTYLTSQAGVLVHYLRLCVWPVGQTIDYGWPVASSAAEIVAPGLVIVAMLAATGCSIPHAPAWSFLGGAFFLILTPTSSILPIRDLAFEHRMYLPLAPVVVAAVIAGKWLLGWRGSRPHVEQAAVAALVLVLGLITYLRNNVYGTELSLWSDVVAKAPSNPRGYSHVGRILIDQGDFEESLAYSRRAVELAPFVSPPRINLARALMRLQRHEEAASVMAELVAAEPGNSSFRIHYAAALKPRQPHEAVRQLEFALASDPNSSEAYNNLGMLLCRENSAAAEQHYRKSLAIDPRNAEAHNNLANLLAREGAWRPALEHYTEALRLRPDFELARRNLTEVNRMLGEAERATGPRANEASKN